ncbi:MAG: M48 family metalloprotease [Candidatus Eremiobacteraeota bacterium]|nr:M48 family metalloprotease [Candidatus Eremiobacteraeota bacterium]
MFSLSTSGARAQSAIDRRVSAIPAATLLSQSPAQLVDPNRQAAAQYYARYTRPAWFVWIGLQILALLYLWGSGRAARVRDWLRRTLPNIHLVRFVFGAFLALVLQAAALPAHFYDYRILRIMEVSTQPPASFWSDVLLNLVLQMLLFGAAVGLILWMVDRTRLWWLYVMLLVFAGTFFISSIYPVAIQPLFNHFTVVSTDKPLGKRLHDLARKAGEGDVPIYVSDLSRRTKTGDAYVDGLGPSKRIVVGDTFMNSATPDEVVFLVAHEIGHDVHHDVLRGTLFAAVIFIFGAALAVLISDRIGFRRDDDPLSRLALVGALLVCMYLLFLPAINGYSRGIESEADAYALSLDPDRVAGTRSYVRLADEGLSLVCPGRLARLFWYSHPPIGTRISRANGKPNPCP